MITPVLPVYNRTSFALERGEGVYLYTTEGKKMLDFAAGIAVNAFGHCHPHLVGALKEQAAKLWHTSNLYRAPNQERLAGRLTELTFADTVFFCNSGAEAVETGIKMVRKYHDTTGNPERYRMITFDGAFHGRTLTTIWAAGKEKLTKGFEPKVDGFDVLPWGDMDAVKAAITPFTGGILIEPVQGEGGIRVLPPEQLRTLRKLCDEHGLLLMLDEVQCGMGRTGKFFAYEHAGITPDIMAVAKGIGGGFPMGACLASEKAAGGMGIGSHGSTYGGNPLAMAVGNAVMDLATDTNFLPHINEVGGYLKSELQKLAAEFPGVVKGVRGIGLILGLEMIVPNLEVVDKLRTQGLLTVGAGDNVIRIIPPLIIENAHVDEAMTILRAVCREYAA